MRRDEILQETLKAVKGDYAGYPERAHLDQPEQYLAATAAAWSKGELDDTLFSLYISQYLASLQDRNLWMLADGIPAGPPRQAGFKVRRFQDELYVTELCGEDRLQVGDCLETLNSSPPAEHLRYTIGNIVNGENPERQIWNDLVAQANHARLRHIDGSHEDFVIREFDYKVAPYTAPRLNRVGTSTACLRLGRQPGLQLTTLLTTEAAHLAMLDTLVIDLSACNEGLESDYYPLLDLLFSEHLSLDELSDTGKIYTNYTQRNCELRIRQLEALRISLTETVETAKITWIDEAIVETREKSGCGLMLEDEPMPDYIIEGRNQGTRVILLTDTFTENAAETFVQMAQRSPLVSVVGRPTMGSIDYSDIVALAFDENYTLVYPMSKTEAAVHGQGISGHGLSPDCYIAWTPEECHRDILLTTALA
jgi:hypothetical protein